MSHHPLFDFVLYSVSILTSIWLSNQLEKNEMRLEYASVKDYSKMVTRDILKEIDEVLAIVTEVTEPICMDPEPETSAVIVPVAEPETSAVIVPVAEPETAPAQPELTVKQIKMELDKLGISYPKKARKSDLLKILEENS